MIDNDPGEVPVLDWLDKSLIDADPLYQRPIDMQRVAGILQGFTWRSFGAIVVVPQADGRYHATDGQHRLEAAKRHPKITHVPAVIVRADDVPAEAVIFVEINKNRKNVSGLELFFAQLAAGDEHADTIRRICHDAGVRIPKYPSDYRPGDSVAVAAIGSLAGLVGAVAATDYLKVLVGAGFSPITAAHIKAIGLLMTDKEFAPNITLSDLEIAIKATGAAAETEGRRFAATHNVPAWKGLANVWFQKTKKRRAPSSGSELGSEKNPSRAAAPVMVRTAVPGGALPTQRNVTASAMGDPPPGRSALDQRRAGA